MKTDTVRDVVSVLRQMPAVDSIVSVADLGGEYRVVRTGHHEPTLTGTAGYISLELISDCADGTVTFEAASTILVETDTSVPLPNDRYRYPAYVVVVGSVVSETVWRRTST